MVSNNSIPRLFDPPQGHFFLIGPRGAGKTAWCKQRYPGAEHIDLTDLTTFSQHCTRPDRILDVDPRRRPQIVIDEIQKLPVLFDTVGRLLDRGDCPQIVLSVSNTNKLGRMGFNPLTGRIPQRSFHPLLACELGERFALDSAMRHGMLPIAWIDRDPAVAVHACNSRCMREEIQAERLVSDINEFGQFLENLSLHQAKALDLTALYRASGLRKKTVERYVDIVEDALLAFRIPGLVDRASRAPRLAPKFYFFDVGIYRANRPAGLLDGSRDADWAALESLVAQHLKAWSDYCTAGTNKRCQLYYWKGEEECDVDFVLYEDSQIRAIDVKNVKALRPDDFRGLNAFKREFPESTCYLLYRGAKRFKTNNIICFPCDTFLRELRPVYTLKMDPQPIGKVADCPPYTYS